MGIKVAFWLMAVGLWQDRVNSFSFQKTSYLLNQKSDSTPR
jgi:hypothetical protein